MMAHFSLRYNRWRNVILSEKFHFSRQVAEAVRIRDRLAGVVKAFRERFWGIKGDLSIVNWNFVDPIASAQYQFLVAKHIQTLKVSVKNTWPNSIDFQLQARLQGVSDWVSKTYQLAPKKIERLHLTLPLSQEKLFSHEEKTLSFDLKCKFIDPSGKELEIADSKPVRILAKDDMIWAIETEGEVKDLSHFIAAWVTPRDPVVQELVHKVADDEEVKSIGGLVGYQETRKRTISAKTTTVPPRRIRYFMLHMRRGATLTVSLRRVSGGANNDINFYILNSSDFVEFQGSETSQAYSRFGQNRERSGHSTNFRANVESDYFLVFDNRFSVVSSKSVQWYIEEVELLTPEEIVSTQLSAFYRTIRKNGMNYVNAHISFAPGHSQRVKRPCDTIRLKGGNCIDGSVLFASCFEAIGFEPIIVIVPGHAFVGVRSWSDSDRYFFIETTMVSSSNFTQSLQKATQEYEQYSSSDKRTIDIKKAREEGIKPLF